MNRKRIVIAGERRLCQEKSVIESYPLFGGLLFRGVVNGSPIDLEQFIVQ